MEVISLVATAVFSLDDGQVGSRVVCTRPEKTNDLDGITYSA